MTNIGRSVSGIHYPNRSVVFHDPTGRTRANGRKMSRRTGQVGRPAAGFGDKSKPLLVSVRSGARASMPGMMDTVLNLGLNDETVEGLAKSADERFAYDSYRRFIQMYSDVVLEIDKENFEHELVALREKAGAKTDALIPAKNLKELVETYKGIVGKHGKEFPQNVEEQLWGAIGAVFLSWQNARAITYRKLNGIPDHWGLPSPCSRGGREHGRRMRHRCRVHARSLQRRQAVLRRIPANAQGEDVVAGIRTPLPITKAQVIGTRNRSKNERVFAQFRTSTKARVALPRHAGHRVHIQSRKSTAPDSDRQANGFAAVRSVRDGRRGTDLEPRQSSASKRTRSSSCSLRFSTPGKKRRRSRTDVFWGAD